MMDSHVIQVTNIAPSATDEQIHTVFSFLGPIDDYQLYPKIQDPGNPGTKVAFIQFQQGGSVGVAQHLTNTVFIDRPLVCVPFNEGIIPDETFALQFVGPSNLGPGMQMGSMDAEKLDEIRRTIYVGNLDSKTANAEQLMKFFSSCGEVKFVRMAGEESQPTRFAFVEFGHVDDVEKAMKLNGSLLDDRPVKINHSNNAIVKPNSNNDTGNSREIEEAMKRVREAQALISRALEPEGGRPSSRRRSRSRSRDRHRRRDRRSRSRERSRRRRSRSRSPRRPRRSRSRDRSRRSRRSRSKSRDRKRRSRSRSKRRSPSRSPSRKSSSKSHRKDKKRDHKRSESSRDEKKSGSNKENGTVAN